MIAKPAYMNYKQANALVAANAGKINLTGSVLHFPVIRKQMKTVLMNR
jgi:hypothetical protein